MNDYLFNFPNNNDCKIMSHDVTLITKTFNYSSSKLNNTNYVVMLTELLMFSYN